MRFADPVLLQDLDRRINVATVFTIEDRQPDRGRPKLYSGEPAAHLKYMTGADPDPEQPRLKVKIKIHAARDRVTGTRGGRSAAGTSLETTLGTYWARTWRSDSAGSANPLATRGFQGWA
jgi:hypothetical protein